MALEFGNRIAVGTSTTGTGTITLGSAVSDAFMTFAEGGITDGATVHYLITEGDDFEIGTGTYTSSGTTLSRDTVIDSKISGTAGTSKMNLGGSAEVRVIADASDFGGGLALVSTTDLSSGTPATVEFTGLDAYNEVFFFFQDVRHSDGSNANYIEISCSHDGGSTYGDFGAGLGYTTDVNPSYYMQGWLQLVINEAGNSLMQHCFVDYASASTTTGGSVGEAGDAPDILTFAGTWRASILVVDAAETVDAIKYEWELGANFSSGTIKMYAR